jgi:hypothetical protein
MFTWIGRNDQKFLMTSCGVPIRLWGYILAAPPSMNQKSQSAGGFNTLHLEKMETNAANGGLGRCDPSLMESRCEQVASELVILGLTCAGGAR